MSNEIFIQIDDTTYYVSNKGNIKNNNTIIKPVITKKGYATATIYHNNKKINKYIHRLVAQYHLPNNENKKFVNHIDENKLNNDVSNLEWCTALENNIHGTRLSRCRKSMLNNEKLSHNLIGYNLKNGFIVEFASTKEAGRNGFNQSCVWKVINNKQEKHKNYVFMRC